jgi:hypothetical protein
MLLSRRAAGHTLPSRDEIVAVSRGLLGDQGTRWSHVQAAGQVAETLAVLFHPREAELLVAAATLHDIGYAPQIAHTGFHPLDGALFLRTSGYPPRLVDLVAHHSQAVILAHDHGIDDLEARFAREDSLVADALVYSDMHSSPEGTIIDPHTRLADIARRHATPNVSTRAALLRGSIARVDRALHLVTRLPSPRIPPT